jgi:hypothetical protein
MKRCIDVIKENADRLTAEELYALANEITAKYTVKAALVTDRFFREAQDVFFTHIVARIALEESIETLLLMKGVCKQWRNLVGSVRHVNLIKPAETYCFAPVVVRLFPLVQSLRADRMILTHKRDVQHLGKILELEIVPAAVGFSGFSRHQCYTVEHMPALRSLKYRDCWHPIDSIFTLTQLTRLEICCSAFHSTVSSKFAVFTQLRHLRIRHFSFAFDVTQFPRLAYLNTDCALHFARYTGDGVLSQKEWPCDDDDYSVEEQRALEAVVTGPHTGLKLTGKWANGVFSGNARIYTQIGQYIGEMVNNRRHGTGIEEVGCDDGVFIDVYKGEWRQGVRHGFGELSRFPKRESHLSMQLVRRGRWENGVAI